MSHRKLDIVTPKPEPTPTVCRKLRTKVAFGSPAPALADWRHGTSTTAVYWCLRTMESAGPDEALVHAQDCRAGRTCFIAPDGTNPDLLA